MADTGLSRRVRSALRRILRGTQPFDPPVPSGVLPANRESIGHDPLTVSAVFRAVQVLQTAISSLPIFEMRAGLRLPEVSALVERPDANRSRRDFIADIVASLALDGNAFIRFVRYNGQIVSCEILPPALVTVSDDGRDPASPHYRYSYLGHEYTTDDVFHARFLNVPGRLRGLGPISAAREELEGAAMAREYKSRFYEDSSNLKGYMTTDQAVTVDTMRALKDDWVSKGKAGDVRFINSGFKYVPLDMKPADLQFLETQKFDTTQIARLMGVPASIMLAAVDGSNLTYANIEQSWMEFADYTLAAYAGEIEELFSRLLPRGRTARFDWDSGRRANMGDRMNAYSTAIAMGLYTVDELRARENLPPLPRTDTSMKQEGGDDGGNRQRVMPYAFTIGWQNTGRYRRCLAVLGGAWRCLS